MLIQQTHVSKLSLLNVFATSSADPYHIFLLLVLVNFNKLIQHVVAYFI